MPATWPRDLEMRCEVPQMFSSDGGDNLMMVGRARYPGIINSVEFIPNWNLTGANTNSRTFTLYNRGQTGTGTTAVAALALTSGQSLVKFSAKALTISSANATIAAGDVLEWESLHVGTGLPDPGGKVIVQHALTT